VGSVVFTAAQCFDPETQTDWPEFVARSGLAQLREVVSLDQLLCPNLFQELAAEDWTHNVHENLKTHLFYDADYVRKRVAGKAAMVLALIEEPSADDVESFRDPRFAFCGFDLIDAHGGISALTNCGGFDRAFLPRELSECGLLLDHSRARAVQQLLKTEYPDEPHAPCRLWAIWKMRK
jgi:hypothetical protein